MTQRGWYIRYCTHADSTQQGSGGSTHNPAQFGSGSFFPQLNTLPDHLSNDVERYPQADGNAALAQTQQYGPELMTNPQPDGSSYDPAWQVVAPAYIDWDPYGEQTHFIDVVSGHSGVEIQENSNSQSIPAFWG